MHQPRAFFGDFGLWREGVVAVEHDERGLLQVHQGVDRDAALVVPASGSFKAGVEVRTLGAPHPSEKNQRGWRSTYAKVRQALRARGQRSDPLVWVEDDSLMRVVATYAGGASIPTTAAHGRANGDVVLIRRTGAGLYTLGVVTVIDPTHFSIAPITGTTAHAIATSDQVHLVEQYWFPMVYRGLAPAPPQERGDWYAKELVYSFEGSASATYERTSATVGA